MAKYIIIGLGNFGAALGEKLTEMGHEVIGIDNSASKVEGLKDKITHTICMDVTEEFALKTLPLQDASAIIVAIGENYGASIQVTALLKQLCTRRVIGRVISAVHKTVIQAIGVDELIMPEEDSAMRLAKSLDLAGVMNSFELADGYSIVEASVPERYVGKSIQEVDFRGRYNLNIITIKKLAQQKNLLGKSTKEVVMGVITPQYTLEKEDKIVIFGKSSDLEKILGQ